MQRLLKHPMTAPAMALLFGVLAAWLLARTIPVPSGWHVHLPLWLAELLSDDAQRDLVLNRVDALWLMPIAVAPFLVVMATRTLVDVKVGQVVAQIGLRLLVLMALALALAQPTLRAPVRGKTVVFAVDVSASVDEAQLEAARARVVEGLQLAADEEAAGVAREDRTRVRVLTYGERARALDLEALEDPAALKLEREQEGGLASDHAGALRLAAALMDPETEGRVVLMTDGTGDLAERHGLAQALGDLESRGVTVHTRSFDPDAHADVAIAAVNLPEEIRIGQSFEVSVDLVSTVPANITLHLDKDGAPNPLAPSMEVELRGGKQQVKLPARATKAGAVVFTARLDTSALGPGENRRVENDKAAVVGEVRGRPRVLHVGSDQSSALVRALGADHLSVDDVSPDELPNTAEGLRPFDLVVFSDIPARRVSTEQQRAIVRWVKEYGGGFIMIGGESSFGVGGWGGTPIESVLPVRFSGERQREQPTLALVLVIDKSGSMSSQDKLDLVKEAARATARTLDPSDEIGVIAFDSRPQVLVRLQPAANRLRISSSIRRLAAGGGTNALPALREAYLQLAGSKALVKHVILLSDGQSPSAGVNSLLADMRDADITVSTVGVGSGAGKDFLARVAERGRGRYYFSQDGTDVPRIFSKETREVTRNALVERQLFPRVAKNVQALRGIDFGRAPGLRGIVPVQAKKQAEVLLRTHLGDTLLARGRRGLGRTLAFASDAKPRWAASWVTWPGFAKLWSQLARDTMRQGAGILGGAKIGVRPAMEAGAFQVIVDVESPDGFADELDGTVEVIDPSLAEDDPGHSREVELRLTAPGRYEGTVHGVDTGQRLLKAQLFDQTPGGGRLAAEAVTHVSVPYPAELAPSAMAPQHEWLASLTELGTTEGPVDEVVTTPGEAGDRDRARPLWPEVLVWLLLPLVLIDLLLRRVSFGVRRIQA